MSTAEPEAGTATPEEQIAAAQAATAEAQARADAAERRASLVGVLGERASTPVGAMFLDAYKGELTAEAITAEATAVGLIVPPPEQGEVNDGSTDERTDLRSAPGDPGAAPTADPYETARSVGKAAWERGTEDDGLAAYFGSVVDSAVRGDSRVILDYMNPRNQGAGAR